MAVVPVTATLNTAADTPDAGSPPCPLTWRFRLAPGPEAYASAGAVAGVEDASGHHPHVATGVARARVLVPPGHVEDDLGVAGGVVERHLPAGAELDHRQVGDRLARGEVDVRRQRPGGASGEQGDEAGARGPGDGDVDRHRRHAARRDPALARDLDVDGGSRTDRPRDASRAVAGVEDAGRRQRPVPAAGRRRCGDDDRGRGGGAGRARRREVVRVAVGTGRSTATCPRCWPRSRPTGSCRCRSPACWW